MKQAQAERLQRIEDDRVKAEEARQQKLKLLREKDAERKREERAQAKAKQEEVDRVESLRKLEAEKKL